MLCSGGGSSVGRFAIQIAKAVGAHVVVSCSSSSREACLKLGADEVSLPTAPPSSKIQYLLVFADSSLVFRSLWLPQTVDYTTSPLESQLASSYPIAKNLGFNLIFDTIGPPRFSSFFPFAL